MNGCLKKKKLDNALNVNHLGGIGREMKNKIIQGDCLELMKDIPDKSVDMILCDLPYGTTRNKWDLGIHLDKIWRE